ncbi:hypothetical protein B9Z55_021729 [Caenorhabditis nigoni]|uniref:DUF281 domain-containing protein n=2 Tax=Caenorhabditis nigoni TaxID=1611254 RepID=A0A2G5TTE5_9PELO|nr:hypothetical protein B9Z55_021729 [Caenorhabditis nigoni]
MRKFIFITLILMIQLLEVAHSQVPKRVGRRRSGRPLRDLPFPACDECDPGKLEAINITDYRMTWTTAEENQCMVAQQTCHATRSNCTVSAFVDLENGTRIHYESGSVSTGGYYICADSNRGPVYKLNGTQEVSQGCEFSCSIVQTNAPNTRRPTTTVTTTTTTTTTTELPTTTTTELPTTTTTEPPTTTTEPPTTTTTELPTTTTTELPTTTTTPCVTTEAPTTTTTELTTTTAAPTTTTTPCVTTEESTTTTVATTTTPETTTTPCVTTEDPTSTPAPTTHANHGCHVGG